MKTLRLKLLKKQLLRRPDNEYYIGKTKLFITQNKKRRRIIHFRNSEILLIIPCINRSRDSMLAQAMWGVMISFSGLLR